MVNARFLALSVPLEYRYQLGTRLVNGQGCGGSGSLFVMGQVRRVGWRRDHDVCDHAVRAILRFSVSCSLNWIGTGRVVGGRAALPRCPGGLVGVPVSEVAARFGVSRQSVHAWVRRYDQGGLGGLMDRSRRPESCPHQVSVEIEAAVCELRREHPRGGGGRCGWLTSWAGLV